MSAHRWTRLLITVLLFHGVAACGCALAPEAREADLEPDAQFLPEVEVTVIAFLVCLDKGLAAAGPSESGRYDKPVLLDADCVLRNISESGLRVRDLSNGSQWLTSPVALRDECTSRSGSTYQLLDQLAHDQLKAGHYDSSVRAIERTADSTIFTAYERYRFVLARENGASVVRRIDFQSDEIR